ncbi:MAG: thiamine pyrophosphate-dependent enzyme [Actinomycetota bacterium]
MGLDDTTSVEMLREMIAARHWSTRAFNLQRQGRAGTNAPVHGSEAIIVGTAHALDPTTDWVIPQYREPVGLHRFGPDVLDRYVLYLLGHPAGGHHPEGVNVFPISISLATQIPHAVGLAWAKALRDEPGVVVVFFGDGSTSEGDFYEAGNLAGVLGAPVILCCVNNHWAISTPLARQTRAAAIADKAAGFGIPGVQVDGTDPVAVHEVMTVARERAVAGEGPTLVEAVTYRLHAHTTADDPTRYVPPEELAEWQEKDPVDGFRATLRARGLWDDDAEDETMTWADARFDEALEWAEAQVAEPADILTHALVEPTPRMRRQLDELGGGDR